MINFNIMKYDPYLSVGTIFEKYILALQEYTHLPLEEIERLGHSENDFKNKFTTEVIQDKNKIIELYTKDDVYLFANPYYYKDNLENRMERFWKPIVENPGSVLDYGCGAAVLDELLWRKGITDITLCDLPSRTFKFVQFFFGDRAKYEHNENELIGRYDWIICNSVLEHIPDPIKVVQMWGRHLTSRGKIIDSMATDVSGPHLQVSINKYNEVKELIKKINHET